MDRDQLIEAVVAALQVEEGERIGLTARELADKLEWSPARVHRALRAIRKAGRLESSRVPIMKINNVMGVTWAYYLKEDDDQPTETGDSADSGPDA